MENNDKMTADPTATSKYASTTSAVDNFLSSIITDASDRNGLHGTSREVPSNSGMKRSRSPDNSPDGSNTKRKLNTGRSSGELRKEKSNSNARGRNDNHRHNDKRKRVTDLECEPETRLIARRLRSRLQPSDLRRHFEKYGEVLEVTLKNDGAYGFVQFLDAGTCAAAVRGENGKRLNGCQLELEVCRGVPFQRSQERRNRKDPRNARDDDRQRPRTNDFYRPSRDDIDTPPRRRSSSEYSHSSGVHMNPALKKKDFPLPSRHGDSVPVVQVIAMGDADRPFISYVESAFRTGGISIHTLFLQPGGLSRHAIVKQMIYEGVKAVVIIERGFEIQHSLYLQVFDRSSGMDNDAVRFDEYDNVYIDDAVAIVQRTQTHIPIEPMMLPPSFNTIPMAPPSTPYVGYVRQAIPSLLPTYAPPPVVPPPHIPQTLPSALGNGDTGAVSAILNLLQNGNAQPANTVLNPNANLLQAISSLINNNSQQQQQQQQQQQTLLLQQLLMQLTAQQQPQSPASPNGVNPILAQLSQQPYPQPSPTQNGQPLPSVNELVGKIRSLSQRVQQGSVVTPNSSSHTPYGKKR